MTNEEKQLLVKDLCGRLPYGVICKTHFGSYELLGIDGTTLHLDSPIYDEGDGYFDLEYMEIQPFLRPMSSMTEEEEIEMTQILEEVYDSSFKMDKLVKDVRMQEYIPSKYVDWLNKHHFDYRGLIPKGLALPAPEKMYN